MEDKIDNFSTTSDIVMRVGCLPRCLSAAKKKKSLAERVKGGRCPCTVTCLINHARVTSAARTHRACQTQFKSQPAGKPIVTNAHHTDYSLATASAMFIRKNLDNRTFQILRIHLNHTLLLRI